MFWGPPLEGERRAEGSQEAGRMEVRMEAFLRRGVITGREATMMEKENSRDTAGTGRGKC